MELRFEVQVLVVVVVLLAPSVSEGRMLNKCELRDQLNTTLPASVLNFISLSKIVCIAELSSGFNTSAIDQISVPDDDDDDDDDDEDATRERGPSGRRKRSRGSSSEESSEEPKRGFASSTVRPATALQGNGSSNRVTPANATKTNDSFRRHHSLQLSRKSRSVSHAGGLSHLGSESSRSSSSEESDAAELWTFYGLFQLPDRIACSSCNLCNMTCNSLIDDDLSDDIACVGTIVTKVFSKGKKQQCLQEVLQKMLPTDKHQDPFEEHFQKLSVCNNVVDSQYFSNC